MVAISFILQIFHILNLEVSSTLLTSKKGPVLQTTKILSHAFIQSFTHTLVTQAICSLSNLLLYYQWFTLLPHIIFPATGAFLRLNDSRERRKILTPYHWNYNRNNGTVSAGTQIAFVITSPCFAGFTILSLSPGSTGGATTARGLTRDRNPNLQRCLHVVLDLPTH